MSTCTDHLYVLYHECVSVMSTSLCRCICTCICICSNSYHLYVLYHDVEV